MASESLAYVIAMTLTEIQMVKGPNFLFSHLDIWMLKCVRNIKMEFNRLLEISA